jgi:ribosomal protein S18 acetylase RimI-like enzyme
MERTGAKLSPIPTRRAATDPVGLGKIQLRSITIPDLSEVADVHISAYPDSTLTLLGKEAVRRYYEWQMIGPHSASTAAAFSENKCIGLYFGGIFREPAAGFVSSNRLYIMWRILTRPWLLTSSTFRQTLRLYARLLWNRWFSRESRRQEWPRTFHILSLAVAPPWQRTGIGTTLLEHAESVARRNSFQEMSIRVRPRNDIAVRFCSAAGWIKTGATHFGYDEMKKELISR